MLWPLLGLEIGTDVDVRSRLTGVGELQMIHAKDQGLRLMSIEYSYEARR